MSIFAVWCVVSGMLFCNFFVYACANSDQVGQLCKSNSETKTLPLPEGVWGQFAFRGIYFVLGSMFFAVVTTVVLAMIRAFAGPFQGARFAIILSSWLGGLYCVILPRIGAKISYWTAWCLQFATP